MPRADGSLYNFERDRAKPAPAKVQVKPVAKPKPKKPAKEPDHPVVLKMPSGHIVHPLHPAVYKGDNAIARNGRPARVKVTPELIEMILERIRTGLSIESSLILAGVHRTAIEKWRKANPALDAQFVKAEVECESQLVGNVRRMAASDLKANQFLLERRWSSKWAPVSKSELTGKDGAALHSTIAKRMLGSIATKRKAVAPVVPMESAG